MEFLKFSIFIIQSSMSQFRNIQYSIENIQLFEDLENIPI